MNIRFDTSVHGCRVYPNMLESRAPSVDDPIRIREPLAGHCSFGRPTETEGTRDLRSAVSRMSRSAERCGV